MSIECTFCGQENPDSAVRCENCGARFAAAQAVSCENAAQQDACCIVLNLYEIRKKKEISIACDGIIGRSGDIEEAFFAADEYVSDVHCRVFFEGGRWKVEHLGHTNPTSINGTELEHNLPMVLRSGDRLKIADLFFKVTLQTVATSEPAAAQAGQSSPAAAPKTTQSENWEITCPVCGKKYLGTDSSFRVTECTGACKYDDFDKYEIAKVLPRKVGD